MTKKTIKIVVDAGGAQRAFKKTADEMNKLGKSSDNTSVSIKSIATSARALGGAVAAVGAVAAAVTAYTASVTKAVQETDNLARQASVSIQTFQSWERSVKSLGITGDELSQTFLDVADRVGEFTRSGGESGEMVDIYNQYLKGMGVSIEELRAMKPDEVLNLIYKGMKEAGASTNEMKSALEQMASNASRVLPVLDGTGEKINKVKDAMQREGSLFTDDDVTRSRILNEKMVGLTDQMTTLKNTVGLALVTPVTQLVSEINNILAGIREAYAMAERMGKFLSTDAQLENIKKMNAFKGGDAVPSNPLAVNTTDVGAQFGYSSGSDDAGGNGGNGGNDKKQQQLDEALAIKEAAVDRELELIKRLNDSEAMQIENWRFDEFEKLAAYHEQKLISEEEFAAAMLEINKKANADQDKLTKDKEEKEKATRIKAKKEEQDQLVNLAYQTNTALDNVAKMAEGRSKTLNAVAQGAATMQATMNMYLAASQAMADWGSMNPIQKAANVTMILGMGANLIDGITSASSRQSGGYMSANTPYQIGGGAHTSDPELYSSGGKSYIVDSQAGMMKRVSGSTSGASNSAFNVTVNNMGEPAQASVRDGGMSEDGTRQLIIEMVPDLMRNESADPDSQFNQGRQANESINWSYK